MRIVWSWEADIMCLLSLVIAIDVIGPVCDCRNKSCSLRKYSSEWAAGGIGNFIFSEEILFEPGLELINIGKGDFFVKQKCIAE